MSAMMRSTTLMEAARKYALDGHERVQAAISKREAFEVRIDLAAILHAAGMSPADAWEATACRIKNGGHAHAVARLIKDVGMDPLQAMEIVEKAELAWTLEQARERGLV